MREIALSFSFSAKRQHQFQDTPESQEQMGRWAMLRTLCEIRWGADALCTFKISFDVILKALEVHDNMQDSNARGFIQTMLKFKFIIALIGCEWLLQFIVPLTNYLQRVDLNLPKHTRKPRWSSNHFAVSLTRSPGISCINGSISSGKAWCPSL